MKIPSKIKIGGKTYTVEITNSLSLGIQNYSAEIVYGEQVIRVSPNHQEKMEADLLHEMIHGIMDFLGYKDHDEKQVDELAQSLYMVIKDNEEMFGTESKQNG